MFTGIVVDQGKIAEARQTAEGSVFSIESRLAADFEVGSSVSIDGVCLTVVETAEDRFSVVATPETLRLTNLGGRRKGDLVNLEAPARLADFLGGHLVQGHVDQKGATLSIRPDGNSKVFRFSAPESVLRYCTLKGSVAVNGVSLTISALGEGYFEVTIIPHTMESTNFAVLQPGDEVNLEADVISKYVESHVKRLMAGALLFCLILAGLVAPLRAGDLPLGPNAVLVYENVNRLQTNQFVVRMARYGPDIVFEWESLKDQGTVHLFREAVEESRNFTLTRLFEVGVDMESPDEMTLQLSHLLFRELLESRSAKLKLNRIPARITILGKQTYTLNVNRQPTEVAAVEVEDSRGGEWLFLDSPDSPLLLQYESPHFLHRLVSVSLSQRASLRWIRRLPPVK